MDDRIPTAPVVGFLHPGAMGAELARTCRAPDRLWVTPGRSEATRARAEAVGLTPVTSIAELAARSGVIVSICPPAAATDVAESVAAVDFAGIYVDGNAIAPGRARSIAGLFDHFVDGGVIGPPPTEAGLARLYLSGADGDLDAVAALWAGSDLDVRTVGADSGAASALKMAYAAWTKGSAALLMDVVALADAEGLTEALMTEWAISQPALVDRAPATAAGVGPKAWRFEGEMHEIAATFAAADLPDGFHIAAAEVYRRLAPLKDRSSDLAEVVRALRPPDGS